MWRDMKLNIKHISIGLIAATSIAIGAGVCHALEPEHLPEYSTQEIEFYDEDQCVDDSSDGTCGDSAKEIYWSALSSSFEPVQAAGIFGNIANKGDFNPVSVESCTVNNPFDFEAKTWKEGWSEEEYLNGTKTTGVGAFGIAADRSKYFDFIEENNGHDLIEKYFLHPEEYSMGGCSGLPLYTSQTAGDALRDKIGDTDFSRLVSLEVEYLQKMLTDSSSDFDMEAFKKFEKPEDAAEYFSMHFNKCDECTTSGTTENEDRKKAAAKAYDEFKDYTCTATVDGEVTGTGTTERLKSAVKVFGKLAMQLQSTFGTPWEVVIAQMGMESGVGVAGSPVKVNNWLGINGTGDAGKQGRYAAYSSVAECVKAWAGKQVLRNGYYDAAFQYLDPNNYDMHNFLTTMLNVYAPPSENDTDDYIDTVEGFLSGPIKEAREQLGYPSSEEYAKRNNIAIGGKYPIGSEIGDDMAPLSISSSSSPSSSTSSSSKVTPAEITLIGDSISVMSQTELEAAFPNSFFTMVSSRSPKEKGECLDDKSGLEILETLSKGTGTVATRVNNGGCKNLTVDSSSLKDTVVWALGTNTTGATDDDTLESVLEYVENNRKLYLVTVYNGKAVDAYNKISEHYREFANQHDNVYIIDWNKAVESDPGKYLITEKDMTVNPTEEGRKKFVELISQATASTSVCASSTSNFTHWSQSDAALNAQDEDLAECGCGPTSFAMLATALLGHEVSPVDVAKTARDQKIWPCSSPSNLAAILAPIYGLEYQRIEASSKQDAANKVSEMLKQGWMIQTSGNSDTPGNPLRSFSGAGHVIGIRGITEDGKWLVANSGAGEDGRKQTLEQSFDPQQWFVNDVWQYELRLDALRASGTVTGNSTNCGDPCGKSNTSSGLVAGGMDLATAQKFMDEYKNLSSADITKYQINDAGCWGGALANCVAFSQYFVNRYTSKPQKGLPNGKDVASYLKSQGFPDGGTTPKPYAIFSTGDGTTRTCGGLCGHTGVVLGIDTANNKIIIGEAGCSGGPDFTGAHEYDLSKYTSGTYTYVYTDGLLTGL